MSILSTSPAYKRLQEKALKKEEKEDDNENKNSINKMDYGKAVAGSEGFGVTTLEGMEAGELGPFLSAPLLTNYNTIDPLTDPILWSSLVPALRPRSLSLSRLQRRRPVQIILSSNRRTYDDPSAIYVCPSSLGKTACNICERDLQQSHTALDKKMYVMRLVLL
ncbi:hypothetical protein OSB04_022954 [Centaurea solstitialis]|uniref:Uncharacterized protein n=1 Tax=Centaurea solstitialis TaxID=347529 RepID=A0AA38VZ44_9ASTR|nr:hypothetical protein OSB04_022954 [Centaurea solstitialis]